ncbi:MAG: hypothetical protein ACE5JR_12400, partial [Gemmatimonadota bacterium]
GVVLYEMLAGRRPFAAERREPLIHSILNEGPPPLRSLRPDVPPELERIVAGLLAKDPEERLPTADRLLEELEAVASGTSRLRSARSPVRAFAAVTAVALTIGLGTFFLTNRATSSDPGEGMDPGLVPVVPFQSSAQDSSLAYLSDGMVELPAAKRDRPTDDIEAYNLYLRGRFLWGKRTKESMERAVEYLTQAIGRDPSFAEAWVGLSDVYAVLATYGYWPLDSALVPAKEAAERAVQLDDELAAAHVSLGHVRAIADQDWQGAVNDLRRAIALDPGEANAHHWLGHVLLVGDGRLEESIREKRLAARLDPLTPMYSVSLAKRLVSARHYEEASEWYERALELDPNFRVSQQGFGRMLLGRALAQPEAEALEEAVRALEAAMKTGRDSVFVMPDLASAFAVAGNEARAREIIRQAQMMGSRPIDIGLAYAALGNADSAFAWLERQPFGASGETTTLLRFESLRSSRPICRGRRPASWSCAPPSRDDPALPAGGIRPMDLARHVEPPDQEPARAGLALRTPHRKAVCSVSPVGEAAGGDTSTAPRPA